MVVMYAALCGDVPRVVNLSGRFDMYRGYKERFGENIEEELAEKGSIPQTLKRKDGFVIHFDLTAEVSCEAASGRAFAVASFFEIGLVPWGSCGSTRFCARFWLSG